MATNKGKSAFEQYENDTTVSTNEKAHLFSDTHTDTEELKTKRMYLLVRPSVAEKISKAAKAQKTSANDLIHQLMEQYIKDNNL